MTELSLDGYISTYVSTLIDGPKMESFRIFGEIIHYEYFLFGRNDKISPRTQIM